MIRNAAKALIIENNKVLMIKFQNTVANMLDDLPVGEYYYDLPGGGQNQYETLEEAVQRECLEETGYTIKVNRLAAVYEEMFMSQDFRNDWPDYAHKVHFLFVCQITDTPKQPPAEADHDMVGAVWVDLADIAAGFGLRPRIIRDNFRRVLACEHTLYLGSARY